VLATAPLGIVGVTAALLVFDRPFGFVTLLGVISLTGMTMRNSLILVDQIDRNLEAGSDAWNAIVGATVRRLRPILMAALAAILAMIPLSRSVFWGPMAVSIMDAGRPPRAEVRWPQKRSPECAVAFVSTPGVSGQWERHCHETP
jgi:multidrug efflux pump